MVIYIVLAIILFGIIIVVHELGHFSTAKMLGVKVNEFAIGMGPILLKKKRGETLYTLRALPVGGMCAMEGEDEASPDSRAFNSQKIWKRFIILVAGSLMNFLLGLIIIMIIYSGAKAFYTPVISGFMEGFPLQSESGLMVGDRIVSIDGERIWMYSDVSLFLSRGNGTDFDLVIKRDGKKLRLDNFPLQLKDYELEGQVSRRYGLLFSTQSATFGTKIKNSFNNSMDFIRLVRLGLVDLISGNAAVKDMTGPVGIIGYMTQAGESSSTIREALENVCYFAALITINIAVVNLLPLPALDGGRIFLMLVTWVIEKIIRKRVNPKYEGYIHAAGLMLFLALMAVITYGDIVRLIKGSGV